MITTRKKLKYRLLSDMAAFQRRMCRQLGIFYYVQNKALKGIVYATYYPESSIHDIINHKADYNQ